MAKAGNIGKAKGNNVPTPAVKPTYLPPGYRKEAHDGKAGRGTKVEFDMGPKSGVRRAGY